MAQQVIVQQLDDITGEPADETLEFSLGGATYVIDLTTANAKRFRDALSEFVDHARRGKRGARASHPQRKAADRSESARIRDWAIQEGYLVAPRGRIPSSIISEYRNRPL